MRSRSWAEAMWDAHNAALLTGYRYRVRKSYARTDMWLTMRIVPNVRWRGASA